jgi:hypothetical protein
MALSNSRTNFSQALIFPLKRAMALALGFCFLAQAAPVQAEKQHTNGLVNGLAAQTRLDPRHPSFVEQFLKAGQYIPVSQIKQGMEGYGLTVFKGTRVEKFSVKVIGVMKRVLNGRDAILVRLSGANLGKNNVVRGMSGSPIYLDGRLAGALSYGFDFSKEPIVGVTPVADMLDALSFVEHRGFSETSTKEMGGRPFTKLGPISLGDGGMRLTPLMAPVTLSGFTTRAREFLQERFADYGLAVTTGASGGLDPSLWAFFKTRKLLAQAQPLAKAAHSQVGLEGETPADSIVPGGAVAVMLSTGDFASAATGTATCVLGNKVIAFGHAFIEAGYVSLPMATAFIHDILPSLSVSFKLSSPVSVIGTIFADRPWSIGGELGRVSQLIPLDVTVVDTSRNVTKEFHTRLINHPKLTSDLVTATIMSALESTYHNQEPHVLSVKTSLEIPGHKSVDREDRFAANFAPHTQDVSGKGLGKFLGASDPVSGYVGGLVDKVVNNDFEKVKLGKIKVEVRLEEGRSLSRIEQVVLDKSVVAPGEHITLHCRLRPYNSEPYSQELGFDVPRDISEGDYAIGISGGDEYKALRKRMNLLDPADENLEQVIARLNRRERGDELCATMALPGNSLYLKGEVLRNLPIHWLKLFFSERVTRVPALVKADSAQTRLLDDIVDGSHILAFTVKAKDPALARQPIYQFSPPAGREVGDAIAITEQAKKALESGRKVETPVTSPSASSPAPATAATEKASAQAPSFFPANTFPHGKMLNLLVQNKEEDFRAGLFDGVVVDSLGRLHCGYKLSGKQFLAPRERIIFATCGEGEKFYFASENTVYSYQEKNSALVKEEPHKLVTIPVGLITALAASPKGELFIGLSSTRGSEVYCYAQGRLKKVATLAESVVSAFVCDSQDNLYFGVSESGKVYKLKDGLLEVLLETGQAHVTSLCLSEAKLLLVGTGERGLVLSYDLTNKKLNCLMETGEHVVTGLARDRAGNLFVATCGAGKLYRMGPNKVIETVALSDGFYTLYYDPSSDSVYGGDGEGDVTRFLLDEKTNTCHFLAVAHTRQEAVTGLFVDKAGLLYAGTANMGGLFIFNSEAKLPATFTSSVCNAQRKSRFSKLRLYNRNGQANRFNEIVKVEFRGGDCLNPDLTWSPWQEAPLAEDGDGYCIASVSHCLQYRLSYKATGKEPIARIDITYQPANQAPSFSTISLKSQEMWKGQQTIAVEGTDPDCDNMLLELSLLKGPANELAEVIVGDLRSRTEEKIIKEEKKEEKKKEESTKEENKKEEKNSAFKPANSQGEKKGPQEKKNSEESRESKTEDEQVPKKIAVNDDALPDKNTEALSKITKTETGSQKAAKTESKGESLAKPETPAKTESYSTTEKFTYSLDTKKYKDGAYLLRLRLTDQPSNAEGALETQAFASLLLDNQEPVIDSFELKKLGNRLISLRLYCHDQTSPLSDALVRFEGRLKHEAFALAPEGALNDARKVVFAAPSLKIPEGCNKLTLEVYDGCGNCLKKTMNVH